MYNFGYFGPFWLFLASFGFFFLFFHILCPTLNSWSKDLHFDIWQAHIAVRIKIFILGGLQKKNHIIRGGSQKFASWTQFFAKRLGNGLKSKIILVGSFWESFKLLTKIIELQFTINIEKNIKNVKKLTFFSFFSSLDKHFLKENYFFFLGYVRTHLRQINCTNFIILT